MAHTHRWSKWRRYGLVSFRSRCRGLWCRAELFTRTAQAHEERPPVDAY